MRRRKLHSEGTGLEKGERNCADCFLNFPIHKPVHFDPYMGETNDIAEY